MDGWMDVCECVRPRHHLSGSSTLPKFVYRNTSIYDTYLDAIEYLEYKRVSRKILAKSKQRTWRTCTLSILSLLCECETVCIPYPVLWRIPNVERSIETSGAITRPCTAVQLGSYAPNICMCIVCWFGMYGRLMVPAKSQVRLIGSQPNTLTSHR